MLFSHALLKEKGWPYHRSHYGKVATAEKVGARSVRFTFDGAPATARSRCILALMPILPRHKLDAETFERTTLEPPLGSGPYIVASVDAGRSITYRRNPDWWARDLPVTRGRFNFDEIRVEYFRDAASLFEAFKAGEIDLRPEDDPGRWIEGYGFPAVADGRVVKREFDDAPAVGHVGARLQHAPAACSRTPRVRRAFILLFDAEWINRSLFNGALQAHAELLRALRSLLARPAGRCARARAAGPLRAVRQARGARRHLQAARSPTAAATTAPTCSAAHKLLTEAGYELEGGRLVKGGVPLAFEFLAQTRQQERLMLSYARTLERLGIGLRIRQVDSAAILGAPQDLRLRHDPVDLERLAVARQRADQPLEQQGRRHRGLAQLSRRQEPGRRRHDRGAAAGAARRRTSRPPCAPSTAC